MKTLVALFPTRLQFEFSLKTLDAQKQPSNMFMFAYVRLLLVISLLSPAIHSFCPTPPPILQSSQVVNTRELAQIPNDFGTPKIVCIKPIPGSTDLAVCSLRKIWRVKQDGSVSLFLDVASAFEQATGRGLNIENTAHGGVRSIAFHPSFPRTGLFYLSAMENRPREPEQFQYLSDVRNPIGADSVVVEMRWRNGRVRPESYRLLFRVGMEVFDHPIKQMEFRGRNLYIGHGDGSEQSSTAGGGLNNDALGKVLRINPLRSADGAYRIPARNRFPSRNRPGMPAEVFALGFRNPHHLCFSTNGSLFVADAGRDNREEVNLVKNGRNYGWSRREGTCEHLEGGGIQTGVNELRGRDNFEYPVAEFAHIGRIGAGFIGVAIAGGCPVENGSPMAGKYWYSDFPVSGELYYSQLEDMWGAKTRGPARLLTKARTYRVRIRFQNRVFDNLHEVITSEARYRDRSRVDVRFGRGHGGELYWSSKGNGKVYVFTSSLSSS
eukprot:GFKZ01010106.1.p1 GENE.GFKZ01010106.1~~GFKZ01010106.1.p1  ORF type:complete len:494 (-),score=39.64 GFKZ01010106.1:74-1555(-)